MLGGGTIIISPPAVGKSGNSPSIGALACGYNRVMARLFIHFLILLLVLAGGVSAPAKDTGGLAPAGTGVVKEIVDGDTLILDDGREVRLVGIQAPKLPLGRAGFAEWPLAREAKAALSGLALGRRLTVSHGGRRTDRHGRLLAHLHDRSGRWIQGELITQGMARVYSFADNRSLVEEMLGLEKAARAARRGIWAHPFYGVIHQRDAMRYLSTFQLIEGRVAKVAVVRGRAYLNFGKDWRTDFTISIAPKNRRLFRKSGVDVAGYEGRMVRVRGWLRSFNGPLVEATHPEQIEVLGK